MSMQDPIADLLTRIRNAQQAHKKEVSMVHSKLKAAIAHVLKQEGYIYDYRVTEQEGNKSTLHIALKYYEGQPVIELIKRISRPGLRVYKKCDQLEKVSRYGIRVLSTSKGVMSDRQARNEKVGGEVLAEVA